jgi:hypothetical protein
MKRFLVATLAALALATSSSGVALAGSKWCVVDPILTVDGRTSDVTVAFADAYVSAVAPPVTFTFHVPSNSTASVSMPPAPVAYTVALVYDLPARQKRDPVTVRVETLVSASSTFTTETVVQLSRTVTVSALGTSNAVSTISYSVR